MIRWQKTIAIFGYKHWVLSMNKSCWACREWVNERLKECEKEWEIEREWECVRVSFEHRDENKSCSACREWVNERLKECESERMWEWVLTILDMKTKVVQHVQSESMRECKFASDQVCQIPSFCLTFRHSFLQKEDFLRKKKPYLFVCFSSKMSPKQTKVS